MQEKAVYSLLINDTTVNTLTGGRVYVQAPEQQPEFSFVIVTREDTDANYTLDGKTTPDRIDVSVEIYAARYDDAKTLLGAVKSCLHGVTRTTVAGVYVQLISHVEDFDVQETEDVQVIHLKAAFNLFA